MGSLYDAGDSRVPYTTTARIAAHARFAVLQRVHEQADVAAFSMDVRRMPFLRRWLHHALWVVTCPDTSLRFPHRVTTSPSVTTNLGDTVTFPHLWFGRLTVRLPRERVVYQLAWFSILPQLPPTLYTYSTHQHPFRWA